MKAFNIAIFLALFLALTGCDRNEAYDDHDEVEVESVVLGTTVNSSNRIMDETDHFNAQDTIYAAVETEGASDSTELTAIWTYEDHQTVARTTEELALTGHDFTTFHIQRPTGFPDGEYEVSILLNGEQVHEKDFEIDA